MSVISCGESKESPRANYDGFNNQFKVTRTFKVVCNSLADGPVTAMSASALPAPYSSYQFGNESYPMVFAKDYNASRQTPNSTVWIVTIDYALPSQAQDQHSDPKLDLPQVHWQWETYQVPAIASDDDTGTSFQASQGEPFNPQPTMDESRVIITITRNEDVQGQAVTFAQDYQNAINLDTFWGFQPKQVKCQGITPQGPKFRALPSGEVIYYLEVTYVFHCQAGSKTWDKTLLDQGTYYVSGTTALAFKTADGHPYTGLLDGLGGQSATPVYLDPVQVYNQADFSQLGLPQSFAECVPNPTGG